LNLTGDAGAAGAAALSGALKSNATLTSLGYVARALLCAGGRMEVLGVVFPHVPRRVLESVLDLCGRDVELSTAWVLENGTWQKRALPSGAASVGGAADRSGVASQTGVRSRSNSSSTSWLRRLSSANSRSSKPGASKSNRGTDQVMSKMRQRRK
jgi:hypothetical protein